MREEYRLKEVTSKKPYNLKLYGLAAFCTIALVFIGIGLLQAQGEKSDKGNDAQYAWSVVILDGPGLSIKGAGVPDYEFMEENRWGWLYDGSDPNVHANVEQHGKGNSGFYSVFEFDVIFPRQIYFDSFPFYGASFDPFPEDGIPLCIYPGFDDYTNPNNMFYFMQNAYHPHPLYHKVTFRFGTHSSKNQDETDFEQWSYCDHTEVDFMIKGPDRPWHCDEAELFIYSEISTSVNFDYGYFERVEEDYENIDIWKVVVGQELSGVDYFGADETDIPLSDFYVYECEEVSFNTKNKKNTYAEYHGVWSSHGNCDLKFEFLFIRKKI